MFRLPEFGCSRNQARVLNNEGSMNRQRNQIAILASFATTLFFLSLPAVTQTSRANDIPPGTQIRVRMIDSLNSAKASSGDIFHGTLDDPIIVKGKELY